MLELAELLDRREVCRFFGGTKPLEAQPPACFFGPVLLCPSLPPGTVGTVGTLGTLGRENKKHDCRSSA